MLRSRFNESECPFPRNKEYSKGFDTFVVGGCEHDKKGWEGFRHHVSGVHERTYFPDLANAFKYTSLNNDIIGANKTVMKLEFDVLRKPKVGKAQKIDIKTRILCIAILHSFFKEYAKPEWELKIDYKFCKDHKNVIDKEDIYEDEGSDLKTEEEQTESESKAFETNQETDSLEAETEEDGKELEK